jgi:hypothetical protein
MTDGQLAWKATKLAAIVFGGLLAFIFIMAGLTALVVTVFGKMGAALLYLAFLFGIFWLLAALDIHNQQDASVDTLPKGQDAKQGLAGTESGAVPSETSADAQ